MFKPLLTLLVIGLGLWWWLGQRRDAVRGASRSSTPSTPSVQPMVACAHCGVHLPQHEACFDERGQPFCGMEHRRLGAQAPRP